MKPRLIMHGASLRGIPRMVEPFTPASRHLVRAVLAGDGPGTTRALAAGASADTMYRRYNSVLLLAVLSNQPVIFRRLLAAGANPNGVLGRGRSPLIEGLRLGRSRMVWDMLAVCHQGSAPSSPGQAGRIGLMEGGRWLRLLIQAYPGCPGVGKALLDSLPSFPVSVSDRLAWWQALLGNAALPETVGKILTAPDRLPFPTREEWLSLAMDDRARWVGRGLTAAPWIRRLLQGVWQPEDVFVPSDALVPGRRESVLAVSLSNDFYMRRNLGEWTTWLTSAPGGRSVLTRNLTELLVAACRAGSWPSMTRLLRAAQQPVTVLAGIRTEDGRTLVHHAADRSCDPMVRGLLIRRLVRHGVCPRARDRDGATALAVHVEKSEPRQAVIRTLEDVGVPWDDRSRRSLAQFHPGLSSVFQKKSLEKAVSFPGPDGRTRARL